MTRTIPVLLAAILLVPGAAGPRRAVADGKSKKAKAPAAPGGKKKDAEKKKEKGRNPGTREAKKKKRDGKLGAGAAKRRNSAGPRKQDNGKIAARARPEAGLAPRPPAGVGKATRNAGKPGPDRATPATSERYALRVGRILTVTRGEITDGLILMAGGKIVAIGPADEIRIPDGHRVIHVPDGFAMPGLVELHCHIGGSWDINDMVHQVNPELNTLGAVVPNNPLVRIARQGGVTSALYIPGSGTNMSGFGTLIKMAGDTLDEVVMRFPGALKIAQAGNPERWVDFGAGVMGMNWMIRNALAEGRDYNARWLAWEKGLDRKRPARQERLENFKGLFRKDYPVIIHTQMMQVVASTVRIVFDEMKLWPIISHGTFDSYKLAPEVARRGIHVNVGPRQIHYDRREDRIYGCAARWWQGGVRNLSINTDSPVIPQEQLFFQVAMAVRYGLPEEAALAGVTIKAARALGIDRRVGSLETGKDADVVILNGPPFDVRSRVLYTFVNGRKSYDLERDKGRF